MKQRRNNQTVNLILAFFFTSNSSLRSNSDDNSRWSEDSQDRMLTVDWTVATPGAGSYLKGALGCSGTTLKCFPTSLGMEPNHLPLPASQ